ncbi:MAG: hypothetical protein WBL35_13140 [Ornithinibacter sp.]
MPHDTTGLPKLDLEPFDATPLWEAARSHGPESGARPRSWHLAVTVVVLLGLGALGVVLALVL